MQQYRVNYPLLIGLIVGALVCSGVVYGIWKIQIERKSGWLLSEAQKAGDDQDYRDATRFYGQYLSIHPEDVQVRLELGNAEVALTQQDDVTGQEMGEALRYLEQALRNKDVAATPEAKDLRRKLIEIYARFQRFDSALDHLNLILEADPADKEAQVLRAQYLAKFGSIDEAVNYSLKLIGYDPISEKFDAKKADVTDKPQLYSTIAAIIRGKQNKPELADRILDQMVEANPKSAEAYVERGRLRSLPAWDNLDGARSDAEQAYKLKPDDVDVLLLLTDLAARDENFEKATEYVSQAKKLHPDEVRVYQAAAALEMKQQVSAKGDDKKKFYDRAMAQVEEGINKVSASKARDLLFFKMELQLPAQDADGARKTLEEVQKRRNLPTEIIDYYESRILLAEGKWFQASEALSKLRPKMAEFGRDRVMEIDYSLGLCYERLGQSDMARSQYELVLQQEPGNEPAMAGVQRVAAHTGTTPDSRAGDPLQKLIAAEVEKPKAERNWSQVDAMLKDIAEKRQWDDTTTKIFQAQMLVMREDYDAAARLLSELKKQAPDNLQVQRLIVQLARVNPQVGPAKAKEVLDGLFAQFGDQPALRVDKADILIQMNKDKEDKELLKHELANLLTGIDKWTDAQKVELWRNMAGRYLNLNMIDEGRQTMMLWANAEPNELPVRLALFSLALDAGDEQGMKDAQDKILQVVGGDKNDSNCLYVEARRKLALVRRGRLGQDTLPEIRKLANQALDQRPDWFELHTLLAELDLINNNIAGAIAHFDRAEELGRPTAGAVATHIRMLSANGRFNDAAKLIDRIPESARQSLLGPLYAEILFRSKKTDEAIKQARDATVAEPNNANNHYWYGQLLARSSQASDVTPQRRKEIMGEAVKAMRKAADVQPEFPDAWFALINYYAMLEDDAQANQTLRDAQLALSGDNLQLFLARSYEVLHRWFDAETMYRAIYETDPSDIARAHQLAAFYTGPLYQRPDKADKASPLINQILKAGADAKIPANDPSLLWARRTAAKMFASTSEYPKLLKAEKLLTSNSQEGNLLIEDKLALAEILAPRPEPESRYKAIRLLEEVAAVQQLNDRADIQLGELYYAVGSSWTKFRDHMVQTIARHPKSVDARQAYVQKLLARDDKASLDAAAEQIKTLHQLAPNNPLTFQFTVQLAAKLGGPQLAQVRQNLISRMPKVSEMKEIDEPAAQSIGSLAKLLVTLGDLDTAERIYTDLAARVPAMQFDLARFLGEHRDAEKGFAKLNEIYKPSNVQKTLEVGMAVARLQRDKIGDKFDAELQRWLDAGLRENPDSIGLLITQADLFDLQKKYEEAAEVYRKLLERKDLDGLRRAIVLNNLAFLLAMPNAPKAEGLDALNLVEEAAQILGPNSDILDTRAVVLMAQKNYDGAIRDLELSVTDNPTPSKYYHKAVAHLAAGQNKAAVEAWEKAEALKLNRDSLNRMEFDQFEEMKKKIDELRSRKVTNRPDSERKAA